MAWFAAAIPYIAAAVGAVSAVSQAYSQKKASDRNAEIALQNAQVAREEADLQARQSARENYMRLGAIRAAQGGAGVSSAGSVLDVLGDVAAQGELERQDILYRGELKARGFGNTASLDTAAGRNAVNSGYTQAGASLLRGGYNYFRDTGRVTGPSSAGQALSIAE